MMRIFLRIAILAGLLSAGLTAAGNRFVHTDGKHIVAPNGEKLLLRGINLGNWLVPEGYMFHFDKGPGSYRSREPFRAYRRQTYRGAQRRETAAARHQSGKLAGARRLHVPLRQGAGLLPRDL